MAGWEKPSVNPKCSRCSPSSAGLLHVRELEPAALGAQLVLPAPRLVLERLGGLGVHDDEDLELAQLVVPAAGSVAQALGAGRHALADLLREAVEDQAPVARAPRARGTTARR